MCCLYIYIYICIDLWYFLSIYDILKPFTPVEKLWGLLHNHSFVAFVAFLDFYTILVVCMRVYIYIYIYMCVWRYPFGPPYVNLLEPFPFLAGDQLVVPIGVTHISLPLQEYNRRNRRKERTNEQTLGVNSRAERELCNTLHSWLHI